jgi:hypothetical protein
MKCWGCKNDANGVCIFCGRGVCKEHTQSKPNILGVYDEEGDVPQVLMVKNGLWCGICEPIPRPVAMPEIE